jgi:hypothetical protein
LISSIIDRRCHDNFLVSLLANCFAMAGVVFSVVAVSVADAKRELDREHWKLSVFVHLKTSSFNKLLKKSTKV